MRGHVKRYGAGWRCTYYDSQGKRRAKTFKRKFDADNFLTTTQVDQLRGTWVDPAAGRMTVREYGQTWLAVRDIRPTSRERYAYHFTYINQLGDVPLGDLQPTMLREWQASLLSRLARSTVSATRGTFVAMLADAVIDGKIARSPFAGIRAPKPSPRVQVVPLPVETVFAIADTISDRYRAAVLVGIGCGLRRGETFALSRSCVDFLRRELHVHAERGGLPEVGKVPRVGPPKTAASVRTVPMPAFVVAGLAAHIEKYPTADDGVIFKTSVGNLVSQSTFANAWQRSGAAPPGSRFHDLRHFYASALIHARQDVKVVQARLGHATAGETLDTYGHLWPDSEESTRAALDAMFDREPVADVQQMSAKVLHI